MTTDTPEIHQKPSNALSESHDDSKSLKNESLSVRTYNTLKKMIIKNEIRVGVHYLEKELLNMLGISRTPLKEALVRLENEGLIVIQPRHGIHVTPISADDMAEIYQIITALECEAVYNIAQKGLDTDKLEQLEATTQRMEKALDEDNLASWAEADEDFHRLLLHFSNNCRLKQTVLMYWFQAHRARYFTLNFREKPVNSTKDHSDVVNAIRERRPDDAALLHKNHRVRGGEVLLGIIRRYRFESL